MPKKVVQFPDEVKKFLEPPLSENWGKALAEKHLAMVRETVQEFFKENPYVNPYEVGFKKLLQEVEHDIVQVEQGQGLSESTAHDILYGYLRTIKDIMADPLGWQSENYEDEV